MKNMKDKEIESQRTINNDFKKVKVRVINLKVKTIKIHDSVKECANFFGMESKQLCRILKSKKVFIYKNTDYKIEYNK